MTPSAPTPSTAELTRQRLTQAAFEVVRDQGWANASARNIAAQASVSQALVFYHFGTVDDLVAAASDLAVTDAIAAQRPLLADASTLTELVHAGRALSDQHRSDGNTSFMAQVMAAAQHNATMAAAAARALQLWENEIVGALRRITGTGVAGELLDVEDLAPLITAAFVGTELYGGIDPTAPDRASRVLESVGQFAAALDELGPAPKRVLKSAVRRIRRRWSQQVSPASG
ncbi:TetR/AcrR family transcriptional regulator [Branchiibius sp. NY16-3462-2]|uniref:TetR/AcrR family transcriptional regulator n=1 Tax=Branchiibius sp. NY16-3462-2 TaxID=1807500 RepID=UPI0025B8D93B|nr:TetR/AcrR family transcriptional regulator [Branchiibius sp. NY16-3462-2]